MTCDTESRVAFVDVASGEIVMSLPTLADPRAAESDGGGFAVVAHTAEGAVTFVDGTALEPIRVVRGLGQPRYASVEPISVLAPPASHRVFVTDSKRGEVVTLDRRGEVRSTVAVDGPARHLSRDPSGERLWTVLGSKSTRIAVLDVRRQTRLLRHLEAPFAAHDVAFDPSGRRVWVSSGASRRIALYTPDGRLVRTVPSGSPPQHVSFASGLAYVACGDDGTLDVHQPITGARLARFRIPLGSYNVETGLRWVLSPSLSRGTLVVAGRGGDPLRIVDVSASSHDACLVIAA